MARQPPSRFPIPSRFLIPSVADERRARASEQARERAAHRLQDFRRRRYEMHRLLFLARRVAQRSATNLARLVGAPVIKPVKLALAHPVLGTATVVEGTSARSRKVRERERGLASRLRSYPR